jgi:peptidoglycan/LPS O-acetylase OafA/YrhL
LWAQFGFGIIVYDVLVHGAALWNRLALAVVGLETAGFVVLHGFRGRVAPVVTSEGFCVALLFAIALVFLHRFDKALSANRIVRWLCWVGSFSYSLYLTHQLVRGVILQIGRRAHINEHDYFISFAAQIAVSVAAAWLFYQRCEQPFTTRPRQKSNTALVASPPV